MTMLTKTFSTGKAVCLFFSNQEYCLGDWKRALWCLTDVSFRGQLLSWWCISIDVSLNWVPCNWGASSLLYLKLNSTVFPSLLNSITCLLILKIFRNIKTKSCKPKLLIQQVSLKWFQATQNLIQYFLCRWW